MPLATKNNAIIVKDGLLAENCECCLQPGCCNAPTVWQAIYYVFCNDTSFGPCLLATNPNCGCSNVGGTDAFSTYATWTRGGRPGLACASNPGSCGVYDSEEACKRAASRRVGTSPGLSSNCNGIIATMVWGKGQTYNEGSDPNYYGAGAMYDCVRCDNPLP
jgi:hypothetical protein